MLEEVGDLWSIKADLRLITTNGIVTKDGRAVMGRGCALELKQKVLGIDASLGHLIKMFGNKPHYLITPNEIPELGSILTFPVKHHWRDKADPDLIKESANRIADKVDITPFEGKDTRIVCPRPGCGNGGLDWKDVKPIIEPIFDDRFIIVTWKEQAPIA